MMPGVASFPITSREQWLKLREQDVTASTAGALLGVHEYTSAFHLWAIKSALLSDDVEETAPMIRGRLLEPVALNLVAEQRPAWWIEPGKHYFRHAGYRIGATPDAFAQDTEGRGRGIIQVKTVEPGVFRRNWREDGEVAVPLWIAVQAIVEARLTGCTWACVAAMRVGFGLDLDIIEIPLNENVWRATVAAVAEFWRRVESGEGYPPDYGRDGSTIALLNPVDAAKPPLDLRGDNMIGELLDERETMSAQEKAAGERLKAIKAEIVHKLGAHSRAITADGREIVRSISARKSYKSYVVKETTVERLTIRQPREKAA